MDYANDPLVIETTSSGETKISVNIVPWQNDWEGKATISQNAHLSGKKVVVTYKTKLSDEEWDRITSSASGSETFENLVEVTAGDDQHMEDSDKVTVTTEEYITKTDSTKQESGGLVVDENGETSKEITYTVEINPHAYVLNSHSTLKLTDSIATNMDLNPESVKVVYGTMGTDGKLVPGTETPEGLQISYNDDARLLIIDKIPDKTPLVLTYGCYARAQGEDTFTNTATLIGGGSHSASDTKKHTIQTSEAGVKVEGIQFNMLKIDENNISEKLAGAKFQLYKCNLAIGNLSVDDGSNTYNQAWWNNLLDRMNRINAGNGTADDIQWVRDRFRIDSIEQVGEPVTTGITGFTQFTGLREHVLYAWKEVQAPDGYTANGDFHYFVGYQHLDVNSDEIPQPLLDPTEQLNRKHAAWALDDACQLANGIRVASMANLVTWTATNVESQYTSISATKVWEDDSDNLFETRPTGGIRLQLWQIDEDGNKTKYEGPKAINVDDNGEWPTYIWNRLPANYGGTKTYKYTVTEEKVDGYTTTYSDNSEGQTSGEIIVTNKMIPKNTEIHVKKVFDQAENEPKPESITVKLMVIMTNKKTGDVLEPEEIGSKELNEGNHWSASWSKLDTTRVIENTAYDLTYTVFEDTAKLERDGFNDYIVTFSDNNVGVVQTTEDDPLVITNAKPSKGSLKIKKIVAENGNSDSESMSNAAKTALAGTYTFKIYTDAACSTPYQVDDQDVTVSVTIAADGKAVTSEEVTGMPAGDYWIKENELSNKAIVPQDPVKVTVEAGKTGEEAVIAEFTNNYETTKAQVKKVWVNGTPSSLVVELYAHNATDENSVGTLKETVTLNASNRWTSDVINDLPVRDNQGNAITYHWVEGEMPSGYFLTSTSTENVDGVVTTTLTNTKQNYDLKTSYVGKKTWEDSNNVWKTRPSTDQFVVELYQIKKVNGSYLEPGTKMEGVAPTWTPNGNEWIYTFDNLPVFDENGEVIKYYAQEIVPEGYRLKDGTGVPVNTTWQEGQIAATLRQTPCASLEWHLSSLIDLSFVAVKTTGNEKTVVVWTHRIPTPAEKTEIEREVRAKLPGARGRSFVYFSGVGHVETSHGGITVVYTEKDTDGNPKVYLTFDAPSVWSQFLEGHFTGTAYNIGKTEFTNELITTNLEGTKTWEIGGKPVNNATDVTLKLTRKSRKPGATEETIYVKTENGKTEYVTSGTVLLQPTWTGDSFEYENLPAMDPEGNPYDYAVTEASFKVGSVTYTVTKTAEGFTVTPPGKFKVTQTGNDITNTELTAVEVTKVWKNLDGTLPPPKKASVTFDLYKKGTPVDGESITLDGTPDGNGETVAWKASWTDLIKYDENGVEFAYTVQENGDGWQHYTVSYPEDENQQPKQSAVSGEIITNTEQPTNISVTKLWKEGSKDKVFDTTKTITFKLWSKYTDNNNTVHEAEVKAGDVTYTPATENTGASWSTWRSGDLPKKIYVEKDDEWYDLYYYVVEDAIQGEDVNVNIAYSTNGGSTSVPTAIDAAVKEGTITIVNSDADTWLDVTKTWKLGDDALTDAQIAQIAEYEITYKVQQSDDGQAWTDYGDSATMTWTAAAEGGAPKIENNRVDGLPAGKQYRAVETGAKIKLKGMTEFITISVDDPATEDVEAFKTGTNSGDGPFATAFENVIPKTKIKVVKEWSYNSAPATPDLPTEEQSIKPTVKVTLHRGTEDMGVHEIERKEKTDGTYEWVLEIDNLDRYYWDSTNNKFSEYEYYFTENEGSDMNGWTLATYKADDNEPQYSGSAATTKDGTIIITNSKSTYSLPETGGAGTTLIHVIGTGLLILAAIWFILDQKRRFDRY